MDDDTLARENLMIFCFFFFLVNVIEGHVLFEGLHCQDQGLDIAMFWC